MLKISVGSTNPVKLKAAAEAFELARKKVAVTEFDVQSGVSDQPTSDSEAIEGARKRARQANAKGGFDFGVGLEGSVSDTKFGMFLTGWAFLVNGLLWNLPFHMYTFWNVFTDMPMYLIIPFLAMKTKSTWAAIILHISLAMLALVYLIPGVLGAF